MKESPTHILTITKKKETENVFKKFKYLLYHANVQLCNTNILTERLSILFEVFFIK